MPDPTGSTHLQLSDLDVGDVVRTLKDYGAWTATLDEDFEPVTDAVRRCVHKERERRLKPVLDVLGYTSEVCKLNGRISSADAGGSCSQPKLFASGRGPMSMQDPPAQTWFLFEYRALLVMMALLEVQPPLGNMGG